MIGYFLKRVLLLLSIIITVHFATFFLFFSLYTPSDLARVHLGEKADSQEIVEAWVASHHLNKPLFYDSSEKGWDSYRNTLFFDHSLSLFALDLGEDLHGERITKLIQPRLLPSLMITFPQFFFSVLLSLYLSFMIIRYHRQWGYQLLYTCITLGLSISPLFFLLFAQKVFAIELKLTPISGFDSTSPLVFMILPNIAGLLAGFSSQTRWYVGLMRQELYQRNLLMRTYEGMPLSLLVDKHLFRQSLVPIVTSLTVSIPLLITGSLLLETFFSIPGLGSLSLQALGEKDFFVIRAVTIIGVVLYCIGILMTDLLYLKVDPRVKLD